MVKQAAISIKCLKKTYVSKKSSKKALNGVDLEVPKGSFYGLLGPNGAGKSTLINILAGLVVKTEGRAEIFGYDIDTQTELAKKSIGIVPQELTLDPFFTPYEALEYHAGYYGVKKQDRKTMKILKAMGLEEKANASARSLSGGMRRRLLVAKALVHSPKVLILDEPTAGVDVELRTQLWDYVKKLNKNGTTILLTTHYLEEAQELCDHIAVIDHGNIIANDSTKALLKTIDRKKIKITSAKTLKTVPKQLKDFNSIINDEGNIEITYATKNTSFDEILNAIQKADINIKDISTEEADLEEIFKHLTKKQAA